MEARYLCRVDTARHCGGTETRNEVGGVLGKEDLENRYGMW